MRQLTIKLIDERMFQEFEVTTSIDDLRYLESTFVLTPELVFTTNVNLDSTNFRDEIVAATVELKVSLGISFAEFTKLMIYKSLTIPYKSAAYGARVSVLSLSDESGYVSEEMLLESLASGDHVFVLTV